MYIYTLIHSFHSCKCSCPRDEFKLHIVNTDIFIYIHICIIYVFSYIYIYLYTCIYVNIFVTNTFIYIYLFFRQRWRNSCPIVSTICRYNPIATTTATACGFIFPFRTFGKSRCRCVSVKEPSISAKEPCTYSHTHLDCVRFLFSVSNLQGNLCAACVLRLLSSCASWCACVCVCTCVCVRVCAYV